MRCAVGMVSLCHSPPRW